MRHLHTKFLTGSLGTILRWLLRHSLIFIFIIALLLVGREVLTQWRDFEAIQTEYPELVKSKKNLAHDLDRLITEATQSANNLRAASQQALDSRIAALDQQIAIKQREREQFGTFKEMLKGTPIVEAQVKNLRLNAEINVLEQERTHLLDLKLRLLEGQPDQVRRAELERLRQVHQSNYSKWQGIKLKKDAFAQLHPLKIQIPVTSEYREHGQLQAQQDNLLAQSRQADADYQRQLKSVQANPPPAPLPAFELRRGEVDAILQPLRDRIEELSQKMTSNWIARISKPVEEVAPAAFGILTGIILTPIAIKALFYFILAPLAARRPAIRLLPETTGELSLETGHPAMSVVVGADSELLLRAEFLKGVATSAKVDICWLLDQRFPLASLASGMFALTRIRPSVPDAFEITPSRDSPHTNLGVLTLPIGSALVMQPHNLVGVVQPIGYPLRITSHWRLGSLHAWLTLQLRYLAFHGPARLIVQGGRGVRIERADAGRGITQAATIGFSANLAYSTRRCEPFLPYLQNKQELLNDTFKGAQGFYVCEEMPHAGKKKGMASRWWEVFTDALLKVFGC